MEPCCRVASGHSRRASKRTESRLQSYGATGAREVLKAGFLVLYRSIFDLVRELLSLRKANSAKAGF
jgi:hypothetical protein